MDKVKEATDLVDIILNGNHKMYRKFKMMENTLDNMLEKVENKIDHAPDKEKDLEDLHADVVDELTRDDITSVEESIAIAISRLIKEEDYREYFKSMLKKFNVSSPSELDDEKKKHFFAAVSSGWEKKKGTSEGLAGPGGKFGFMGEDGLKGMLGSDSNRSEE